MLDNPFQNKKIKGVKSEFFYTFDGNKTLNNLMEHQEELKKSTKCWPVHHSCKMIQQVFLHLWIKSFRMLVLFSRLAFLRQLSTALRTVAFASRISSAENLCSTIPNGPGCNTLITVSISCSSCLWDKKQQVIQD